MLSAAGQHITHQVHSALPHCSRSPLAQCLVLIPPLLLLLYNVSALEPSLHTLVSLPDLVPGQQPCTSQYCANNYYVPRCGVEHTPRLATPRHAHSSGGLSNCVSKALACGTRPASDLLGSAAHTLTPRPAPPGSARHSLGARCPMGGLGENGGNEDLSSYKTCDTTGGQ